MEKIANEKYFGTGENPTAFTPGCSQVKFYWHRATPTGVQVAKATAGWWDAPPTKLKTLPIWLFAVKVDGPLGFKDREAGMSAERRSRRQQPELKTSCESSKLAAEPCLVHSLLRTQPNRSLYGKKQHGHPRVSLSRMRAHSLSWKETWCPGACLPTSLPGSRCPPMAMCRSPWGWSPPSGPTGTRAAELRPDSGPQEGL